MKLNLAVAVHEETNATTANSEMWNIHMDSNNNTSDISSIDETLKNISWISKGFSYKCGLINIGPIRGSTSSVNCTKTSLCHAQCIAECHDSEKLIPPVASVNSEHNNLIRCPDKCDKFLTDDWLLDCKNKQCVNNCGKVKGDSGGVVFIPNPPTNVTFTQSDFEPTKVYLNWVAGRSKSRHSVFHVVETYKDNKWQYVCMTYHSWTSTELDVCEERSYRVASVNQFGNDGYSSHATRTELPKPTAVWNLHQDEATEYHEEEKIFTVTYMFKHPLGWSKNDTGDFLLEILGKNCVHIAVPPMPIPDIKNPSGSNDYLLLFKIHEAAYECEFYYQLLATSRCGQRGEAILLTVNLTDCYAINNFVCPDPPLEWPDTVQNVSYELDNDKMRVFLSWIQPNSLGSFDEIEYYLVQWGFLTYSSIDGITWENTKLEEEGRLAVPPDQLDAIIFLQEVHREYGIKILAIVPKLENDSTQIERYIDHQESLIKLTLQGGGHESDVLHILLYTSLPLVATILLTVGIAVRYIKQRRYKESQKSNPYIYKQDENYNSEVFYKVNGCMRINPLYHSSENTSALTVAPPPDRWEVDRENLTLGEVLGRGAFGQVVKGVVKTSGLLNWRKASASSATSGIEDDSNEELVVAVKMLIFHASDISKAEFLKEIELMKSIGYHPNVVCIIGCITIREPFCLIVEHAPYGDLLHFLRNHRQQCTEAESSQLSTDSGVKLMTSSLTLHDILTIGRQIAVGMEFLSQKGFVHRDLACRNILVGEHKLVKIGDFGLTRYVYDDKIYVTEKGGKLPLKWMSVESIFDLTFSTASDVWSYGVVLFELITLGGTPYPTIANKDLLKDLKAGYRIEQPDNCPEQLYSLMRKCWKEKPSDRPSFTDLRQLLEELIEVQSSAEYINFDLDPTKPYYRLSHSCSSSNDAVFQIAERVRLSSSTREKDKIKSLPSRKIRQISVKRDKLIHFEKSLSLHKPLQMVRKSADDLLNVSTASTENLLPLRLSRLSSSSDPGYELHASWMGETKL